MRVATFNVHKCVGPDGVYRPDRVAAVIAELNANLVAIQEADPRCLQSNGLSDPGHLLETTGMTLLPMPDLPQAHRWHGNALLVRNKPLSYTVRQLTLPGGEYRGAVVADIDFGFGPIRFVATQLSALTSCRRQQAGAILSILTQMTPMPTVLLGDLNEWWTWWDPVDVFEPMFGRSPRRPSFPSGMPMLCLDRIMGWPHDLVSKVETHKTPLTRTASDHLPVKAVLRVASLTIPDDTTFDSLVGKPSDIST